MTPPLDPLLEDITEPKALPPDSASAPLLLDPADPLPSARAFTAESYMVSRILALRHHAGIFHAFDGAAYRERDDDAVRAELYAFLERAERQSNKGVVPFQPTRAKVDNVHDALRAVCNLPAASAPPCWLSADPGIDPFDLIPCRNGLLRADTRMLLPSTPAFFTLNSIDFAYDAAAPPPTCWMEHLNSLWPDDPESPRLLQEWFGYSLTPDTRFQKMLLLVGPPRSSKGVIARVQRRLIGERNACGPTLASLAENFGLATLIGKSLAIIADARISGRTDTAIIAERLLSISGEDALSIARKFLPDWTGKLNARFMLLTNELPRVDDASGALASRFVVLVLKQSWLGKEDHGLLERFVPELPGILNWALDGRDRLYARGRFTQPESSATVIREFEDLGSPIGAFLRDRCEVGPGHEVMAQRLFESWKAWCRDNGRDNPGTVQTFGRNLRAALPWMGQSFPRVVGKRVQYYEGLRLQEGGEEWSR